MSSGHRPRHQLRTARNPHAVFTRVSLGFRSCALGFRGASLATKACATLQVCALLAAPLELLVFGWPCQVLGLVNFGSRWCELEAPPKKFVLIHKTCGWLMNVPSLGGGRFNRCPGISC